jgi:hypothetical protein
MALSRRREGAGVALTPRADLLPLLQFSAPATPVSELPDLAEIASWAHAQVNGAAASGLSADGSLSRIICPRQLQPNTAYLACLVPTYNAGAQAGISPDLPGDDGDVSPAWSASTTAPFALPVYAHWSFSTREAGDFASLAARLRSRSAPLDVGLVPMEESAPGFGMPAFPNLALSLEGALKAQQTSSTPWPAGIQLQFAKAIGPILTPPAAANPIVAPPMYGTWPAVGTQPTWLQDLNFDPRMRAAAGFGVRAVRADQDNLIASAWDQFQQLRQANQRLRQFQLARVVAQTTLTRHVNALEGSGSFLQLTQPMHTRLRVTLGTTATLNAHLTASRISAGVVAPAFRRLARRRGPLGRQLFAPASPPSQIAERLNQVAGTPRALAIVGQLVAPAGTVLLDAVSTRTPSTLITATAVAAAPGWGTAPSDAPALPPRPPINLKDDPTAPVWLRTGVKTFPLAPDFPTVFSDYLLMAARFRAAATQVVNYVDQKTALISDEPELPQLTATLSTAQSLMVAAMNRG